VTTQIEPYTHWWNEQNQSVLDHDGPLMVVIGDSTAIGIGASAPDNGYVGRLLRLLTQRDGEPWAALNLAQSGARAEDGVERQLPIALDFGRTGRSPSLVICCIGTNDVVWSLDTTGTRRRLSRLMERLPRPALFCLVAGGSPRARVINRGIHHRARELDHDVVNPWTEPGPPALRRLAADRFHPNDLGYALMANALARRLATPLIDIEIEIGPQAGNDSSSADTDQNGGR
jgi:lysophospholipase L1-like esterase